MQKADREVFEAIIKAQANGEASVLCTVISTSGSVPRHAGSRMLVREDGSIVGSVGGGEMESRVIATAREVLDAGKTRIVNHKLIDPSAGDPGLCGGQLDIFMEPLVTEATLLVIGCGHVGKALAELAKWLGWRVAVSDDREDYCNPDYLPGMDEYLPVEPTAIPNQLKLHSETYVAMLTRSVPLDVEFVPVALAANVPYIGVIGSNRRWLTAAEKLAKNGISVEDLARVHSPIGLDLKAETPEEIALSIMAEIVAVMKGGSTNPKKITLADRHKDQLASKD